MNEAGAMACAYQRTETTGRDPDCRVRVSPWRTIGTASR